MKIALNLFFVDQIGGILTYHKHLKSGLISLGHNVDDFYISNNKSKLPQHFSSRGFMYSSFSGILGFEKDEWLKNYKQIMDNYDITIFINACPTLKSGSSNRWMECYNISPRIITVFHDPYLNSRYPWIRDIYDKISKFVCVQEKSFFTVKKSFGLFPPNGSVELIRHPLDLSDLGLYKDKKEDTIMTVQQFKSWKRVHLFIQSIPQIKKEFPHLNIEVIGSGIEQSKMSGIKRSEKYKVDGKWIWDEAINSGMNYRGFVSDEELIDAYQRSKAFVDFSLGEDGWKTGYPNINYSQLEAMKYGGIVISSPVLPNKVFVAGEHYLPVNESNVSQSLIETIRKVLTEDNEDIKLRNFEVLRENFDKQKVAEEIIK